MVIYTREEKVIIIPEGDGCGCQGGGGQPTKNCEREKREAYESGYTAGLHADCGEAIDEAYNSGYTAGLEACSGSTDCSSAVTEAYQSGYTEGYNQGQADCPECSGETCNLQAKSQTIDGSGTGLWNIYPDEGYDGMERVTILDDGYGQAKYQEGYDAGLADCPECSGSSCTLQSKSYVLDENFAGASGQITPDLGYDGFSSFEVSDEGYGQAKYDEGYAQGQADCSGTSCNLGLGVLDLQSGDSGTWIMYADQDGYDGYNQVQITDTGYGQGKYQEGYQSGYTEGYDDALYEKCNLTDALVVVPSGSSGVISDYMPPSEYAGFSSVSVNATEYGQEMYQSGYTAGLAECPDCSGSTPCDCSSAITEAYQSGYTEGYDEGYDDALYEKCNLVTTLIVVPSGGTGILNDVTPTEAAGFSSVSVNATEYGEWKYQSGYTEGYNQGQADCPECDCSSAITEAYQSGITEGMAEQKALLSSTAITTNGTYTSENGWNSVTVNVQQDCSSAITEAYESGYTEGHQSGYTEGYAQGQADCPECSGSTDCSSAITEAYNSGYTEGYAQGQADCPTCQGEIYNAELDENWDGYSDILTGELVNEITITDTGYGQAKYDEGYAAGQAECPECDCSTEVEDAKAMAVGEVNGQMVYFKDDIFDYCVDVQGDFREGDTAIINLKIGSTFDPSDPDCYINIFSNNQQGTNWNYSEGDAYFIFRIYGGGLMVILYAGQGDTLGHHIQWVTQFGFSPNEDYRIVINSQEGLGSSSSMKVYITNETRGTFTSAYTTDAPRFTQVQSNNPFVINGIRKVESGTTTYEGMFGDWYLKSFEIFRPVSQYSQNNELVAAYGYLERTIVNIDGTRYEGVYYDVGGTETTCAVLGEIQKLKIIF